MAAIKFAGIQPKFVALLKNKKVGDKKDDENFKKDNIAQENLIKDVKEEKNG